jgi:hypothetical protein
MAGHTLPLAEVEYPRIGESSHVVVLFALIRTLRVINPGDHGHITEKIHLYFLNICQGGLEPRVFDVGQESLLVANFAIPLSVHKTARNKGIERGGIAVNLRFIPQPLEDEQFALARIRLLGESERAENQENRTTESANHERAHSPT